MATKKSIPAAKTVEYIATGRRKQSIARVRLTPNGNGVITVNKKALDEFFGLGTLQLIVNQPLELTNSVGKYDIVVNVHGGGLSGQAGAIRQAIARALVKAEPNLKDDIKKAGFLTRDSRVKERKKPGLKKARKAPQYSKR
ncbi:MAG TPA: 30S ribosomal protein S9 [Clostridiales bacterium]|nr:30S ribosomal protein S9 [Clostridiales bacterium]